MGHYHKCDDDYDYVDSSIDACSDPDPCAERFARDKARNRRAKKQAATIALIAAGVVAVAAFAFFLVASGIVVFNSGAPDENGISKGGTIVINTDKIGISTDKIIVDKHKKDRHND